MNNINNKKLYENILVSVDNSEHSRYAEEIGVILSKNINSRLTGLHVYSGNFHNLRFKVLEDHLPQKYQKEEILEYQRKIHSVLIDRGLEIISLEYMKNLRDSCEKNNVSFEEKLIDGKNSDSIIDQAKQHDLIIMGSQGIGAISGSASLGSNTERVLRNTDNDAFIARKKCVFKKIFIGIDGSEYSFLALKKALRIAKIFNSDLTIFSSFDPSLHPVVFKSLASVLNDEAGKVFKFKEQEQLHNYVINTSLEDLYKKNLGKALKIADENDIEAKTEVLKGKAYDTICKKTAEEDCDLIMIGRFGLHRGRYETIGSNAERIARLSCTNVLIVGAEKRNNCKTSDFKDNEKISYEGMKVIWSDEAKARLENIPGFARPMAILSIERFAKENGIKIITVEVMKNARGRYES